MKNVFSTVSREIRNGVLDADLNDLTRVIKDRRAVIGAVRKKQLEVGKWYRLANCADEGKEVVVKKINRTRAVITFSDDADAKVYTIPFTCFEEIHLFPNAGVSEDAVKDQLEQSGVSREWMKDHLIIDTGDVK